MLFILAGCGVNYPKPTSVPQFSPDGKNLIVGIEAGSDSGIYTIKLEDMSFHRLVSTPINAMPLFLGAVRDLNAAYSPDSSKIVFCRYQGRTHLFLMDANGKNLAQITTGNYSDLSPQFSHDGKKIYFIRKGDHKYTLCSFSLNNFSVHEISDFDYYSGRISISSDGKSLLTLAGKYGDHKPNFLDMRVISIGGGEVSGAVIHPIISQFAPTNTISDDSYARDAAYLPDGQIVFSGYLKLTTLNGSRLHDDFHSIYKYNQATGQVNKLIETDAHYGKGPSVSSDGKKMSFCTGPAYGCDKIYIANTDGSDLKEINIKLK
jgi:Tol biopolymer transport system component